MSTTLFAWHLKWRTLRSLYHIGKPLLHVIIGFKIDHNLHLKVWRQLSATYRAIEYTSRDLTELQFEMLKANRQDENKHNFCHKKTHLLGHWTIYVTSDLTTKVLSQRWSRQLGTEDTAIYEYGAMVDSWLEGRYIRNSKTNLRQCPFLNHEFRKKSLGGSHDCPQQETRSLAA
jgi:hypothetical protein